MLSRWGRQRQVSENSWIKSSTAKTQQASTFHGRLFIVIAPFLYAAYALLTPPFQSPDEHQHLFRAWQLSEGVIIGERQGSMAGGVLPGGLVVATEREIGTADLHVLNRPMRQRELGDLNRTAIDSAPPRFTNFFAVVYPPVGYLPQAAAVAAGRAVGASVESIVLLGRLLNAALAIALIALAIRLTPWGASVLLWTGLLPMTAAMSASLGQDGLAIGGTCLLLALSLRTIAAVKSRPATFAAPAILAGAVALGKMVYLPMALLGADPIRRDRGRVRFDIASLIPLVTALLLVAGWQWLTSSLTFPPKPGLPTTGQRLVMIAADPSSLIDPFRNTLVTRSEFFGRSNFTFGWLSVGPDWLSMKITGIALSALFLAGDPAGTSPSLGRRLWLVLLALGTAALIILAMFFLYTLPGDKVIDGIQGRYFIPVVAVLLVALLPRWSLAPRAGLLVPWLMVAANLSALLTIGLTFYSI
jgi:hypothetical protein